MELRVALYIIFLILILAIITFFTGIDIGNQMIEKEVCEYQYGKGIYENKSAEVIYKDGRCYKVEFDKESNDQNNNQ